MSLLDALLLEGYHDPHEVYIALRTDGQKGSGTIDDPYDGGTRPGTPLSASLTLDRKELIVATPQAHGFANGETVRITQVAGPSASVYNDDFAVQVLTDTEFKVALDSVPGTPPNERAGTIVERISPTPSVKMQARLYWPVIKVVSGSSHGYSSYEVVDINGVTDAGWTILNGRFVTVGASGSTFWYRLTSPSPIAVPAADITTPIAGAACARVILRFDVVMEGLMEASAVHLGSGVFETRGFAEAFGGGWRPKAGQKIRGSGMGATTLQLMHASGTGSLFMAIGGNYDNLTTGFEASDFTVNCNLGGQPIPAGYQFAPFACGAVSVRGSHTRLRRIRAINFGTQTPTIPATGLGRECFVFATPGSHPGLPEAFDTRIEDCVAEAPSPNNFRETTCVVASSSLRAYHRSCVVRHCFVDCHYPGGLSSGYCSVESVTPVSGLRWRVKTRKPHGRTTQNNAVLTGLRFFDGDWVNSTVFNGVFPIDAIGPDPEREFEFTLPGNPDYSGNPDTGVARVGVNFHAPGVDSGVGALSQGNHAHSVTFGYYHDTWGTRDSTARDNYTSGALVGLYHNMGGESEPASGTVSRNGLVGTFVSDAIFGGHNLFVGQTVQISKVSVNQSTANPFNGFFEVETIPASPVDSQGRPRSFTYRMTEEPASDPDASSAPEFRDLWQAISLVKENNVIELAESLPPDTAPPIGIELANHQAANTPRIFLQVVARDNVIRQFQDAPDSRAIGILLTSCRNALVEGNIMSLANPVPVFHRYSDAVHYANNRSPAGDLIQGNLQTFNPSTFTKVDELATRIEDAMIVSL
jgi:hypothetical protein